MKRILLVIFLCLCSAIASSYLASKQTSKQLLAKQEKYLTALLSSRNSTDITSTVVVLNKIRKGDVDGATELLEKHLDVNLQAQSYAITTKKNTDYEEFIEAIKIAKRYRECYNTHKVSAKLTDSVHTALSFANISSPHKCE